jgi:hypothetical protein
MKYARTVRMRLIPALLLAVACPAWAANVLVPVADTDVRSSDPTFNNGAGTLLNFGFQTLVRFDLTAFAGQTVTGPGTLRFFMACFSSFCGTPAGESVNVFRVLVPWNESTTWNTFGPNPGSTAGEDYDPTVLASFSGTGTNFTPVNFPIPAAVIQGWINNPGTNNGFDLFGLVSGGLAVYSREGAGPEQLIFDAAAPPTGAPEPASLQLIGIAAGFLCLRGWNMRRRGLLD